MESLAVPKAKKERVRAVTCRCHCECGRHFSSLEAFDAHRRGSFVENTRYCADPESVGLVVKADDARCEAHHEPVEPVTVWQTLAANLSKGWD